MQDIELDNIDPSPSTSGMPENQRYTIRCDDDKPSEGQLFTIQAAISDLNQDSTRQNKQETSPSTDHVMIDESQIIQETNSENNMNSGTPENQRNSIGCVPLPSGINMILKTIQKYMKNTMISLLILTLALPWCLTSFYGFITNSGCEDPTIKVMVDISEFCWLMLIILLPIMIKLKLDRLSQ